MAGINVELNGDFVTKRHGSRFLFTQELIGYANCYWVAPRLLGMDPERLELYVERCVPLVEVDPDPTHARDAWDKLLRLHETGWNHRDASVWNMVLHPSRGVLLIDWETVYEVPCIRNSKSYDLYGAASTCVDPEWVTPSMRPEGVWWGSGRPRDPGVWWGVESFD